MLTMLQLLALFLVAVTMTCSLGHALELPGKLRLTKEAYFATQTIYYPGFTFVGGAAEVGAVALLAVLSIMTPRDDAAFALCVAAFAAAVVLHAIFWIFVQPVNKVWLADEKLGGAGQAFFRVKEGEPEASDWMTLRNRWEYAHLARGALATAALLLVGGAIAVD